LFNQHKKNKNEELFKLLLFWHHGHAVSALAHGDKCHAYDEEQDCPGLNAENIPEVEIP